jgi:hypothetical protein
MASYREKNLGRNKYWFRPKNSAKKIVLKGELLISRTKNQARNEGRGELMDSICFKSVQIGSYRKLAPDPHLKWAY